MVPKWNVKLANSELLDSGQAFTVNQMKVTETLNVWSLCHLSVTHCVFFCRLPMSSLSKFAVILSDQLLHSSPLMGHITNILDQKLSSIDNGRSVMSLNLDVFFFSLHNYPLTLCLPLT